MDREDQRPAEEETNSYQLPESLEKFSQRFLEDRTKAGETPRHPLFEAIEQLLAEPLSIRDLVITRALAEIRETVARENAAVANWVLMTC